MVNVAPTGSTPEPQLRTGRGAPLLLLHGALLTWESWLPVLDDLVADHDVLALTLPGHHGGPEPKRPATVASLADHAEQAMDDAGWDTAHLVGNSLGGWLALELAARGRARTVTAIAPAGLWRTPDAADSLLRKFRTFGPLIGLDTDAPPARPSLIRSLLLPLLAHHPATVPNHVAKAMAVAPANCTIVEEIAEDPDLPTGFTALDTLAVPVSILLPEHDRVLPPHIYAPLAATPIREIRALADVGHIPMLEAPALITAEIRATVARASTSQTA